MELVVDTSIVVAAILRKGTTRALLFHPFLRLYSPERLRFEIMKNKEKFMGYGRFSDKQFEEILELVLKQVEIIPVEEYRTKETEARRICHRDESDWPFVALALRLGMPIWSADPDLLEGQREIMVLSTPSVQRMVQQSIGF